MLLNIAQYILLAAILNVLSKTLTSLMHAMWPFNQNLKHVIGHTAYHSSSNRDKVMMFKIAQYTLLAAIFNCCQISLKTLILCVNIIIRPQHMVLYP